jgi:arylsulfatase A-like enzyme
MMLTASPDALVRAARHLLFLVLCLLAPFAVLHAAKPNIIVILTDDHGWADLGSQGVDGQIRTPNLDQLARAGVRFTRGYVTAPQCTPSRAGLMSGRYQNKFGVEQNFDAMPAEVVTLPERLKTVGYTTGISGKWHLDSAPRGQSSNDEGGKTIPELAPHRQGFDE